MSHYERKTREAVVLKTHDNFPLKLMIEYEFSVAYFYVEYGGEKIGLIYERISRAQALYRAISHVLKIEAGV